MSSPLMRTRSHTTILLAIAAALITGVGQARAADGGVVDGGAAPAEAGAAETADAGAADAQEAGDALPAGLPSVELEPGADVYTGIRGRVVDRKTGAPLVGAPVSIVGQDTRTRALTTDERGGYLARLPPGVYTVRARFDFYHGVRLERVRVTRGKFDQVNLVLDPIDVEEDVVVQEIEIPYRADTTTAAAQDQLRKEASGIGEGMGSKQMSQQGASDAASAAKRVVGVTVDKNQLVVRGLGGRYVKVLLNGLPIPNTDPDYPSVDLDLFPTNVIDSLNIQKAFLPDIPGDFAGGTLDITTVSFPRKFTLEAGVSAGFDSQTTFRDRLTYAGGKYDYLGFDDGTRALPAAAQYRLRRDFNGPYKDLAALEAAAETFPNNWTFSRTNGLPKVGADLTVGDAIKVGRNSRFGYLAAAVYDYSVSRQVGRTRPKPGATATGDAEEASNYFTETGSEEVQLAAIATASLDVGTDHSLTAVSMFNRAMEDETKFRDGINQDVSREAGYQKWQLQFLTRTLLLEQLLGDHRNLFGTRLRLRWNGYYALGLRDEPDQRTVAYGLHENVPERWKPTAERLFSELHQDDAGGSLSLRFPLWAEAWGTIGGRAGLSRRTFSNRRFQMYELQTGAPPVAYRAGPESLFGADGLGMLTHMTEFTKPVDGYDAEQLAVAAFALMETPLWGPVSLAGGVRLERFEQDVSSRSPFPDDNTPELLAKNRAQRDDLNFLPGAAVKLAITETMLARAAYGMTVSRPQVRELAPYDYYDFLRDRLVIGNPQLRTATIHNVDLRWEWFFGQGQIVALSGFWKKFQNPIELQIVNPTYQDSLYVNAKGATSLGGELELRSELEQLSRALRHFSVGGNLSLISSQIEIGAEDAGATRASRRLAGQAPYVINLSLRFTHPETRLFAGLVYNVVGPRITDVGVRVQDLILPDVEELAFHSLDFLGSWGIGQHLKLKIKVRNLLMQNRVLRQGSLVVQDLQPGVSGSLGLSYEY